MYAPRSNVEAGYSGLGGSPSTPCRGSCKIEYLVWFLRVPQETVFANLTCYFLPYLTDRPSTVQVDFIFTPAYQLVHTP